MLKQGGGRIVFAGSISAFTSSLNRAFPKRDPPCGIIRTDMLSKAEAIYDVRIVDGLLPQRRMSEKRCWTIASAKFFTPMTHSTSETCSVV